MSKILSKSEIDTCRNDLYVVRDKTTEYCNAISKIITLYKNDSIVRSLFESGSFGSNQLQDLEFLEKQINNYIGNLSKQLIPKTAQYLANQVDLVTGGVD